MFPRNTSATCLRFLLAHLSVSDCDDVVLRGMAGARFFGSTLLTIDIEMRLSDD